MKGGITVAHFLNTSGQSLEELNLENNKIGDRAVVQLANALSSTSLRILRLWYGKNIRLL